ncbi:hypothetical protein [Pontibacter cellulosilyticus]|uniref:Uncharacterized protein n=1 Tax=Pontibacter cellulosilyticus TaxID=1720253 RepID=A0A923SKE7_9BACT|nr:hypothetical protein [Pontibacter cellulosilyticus]MBC5994793.1 hypothetical protein [Pontibacter cellulosilyticus]
MKTLANIFKTGIAVAFAAVIGFGCGHQDTDIDDDTGTAEAIVESDPSAANLNEPRPAPIGDTSVTAEQADRFGEMSPNQDSAARAMERLDKIKRQREKNQ